MRYLVHTPGWLRLLYPKRVWSVPAGENKIHLTFDDGPHPVATPFVLDLLKEFNARATFFCIGKNVEAFPAIYNRILQEGHRTGNHTQHHLNGWKTGTADYLTDIQQAAQLIRSPLFRPPYGRIRSAQARKLAAATGYPETKIIMWDVLSGDFDPSVSKVTCRENVIRHARNGSVIVFHDSEKAFPVLREALPEILEILAGRGFQFCSL